MGLVTLQEGNQPLRAIRGQRVTMPKIDIHNYPVRIGCAMSNIKKVSSRTNLRNVKKFHEYVLAKGISPARTCRYLWSLKKIIVLIDNKSIRSLDGKDIMHILAKLQLSNIADKTMLEYKLCLRKIYELWPSPATQEKRISGLLKHRTQAAVRVPKWLLTPERAAIVAEGFKTPEHRLLFQLLWETGARPSEILGLRVQDVGIEDDISLGTRIWLHLDGKTGQRVVFVTHYAERLSHFIQERGLGLTEPVFDISYPSFSRELKQLSNGLLWPYAIRHSRITWLVKHLTEQKVKAYVGHSPSSKMFNTYVHLAAKDVAEDMQKVPT